MKYVKLNTDAEMPMMGLGTWQAGPGEVYNAIRWAFKVGYRHLDCAAVYGNEKEVGQAIHDAINEGDIKREEIFVTSKLWNDAHAPEDVLPALKKTLKDLQLDYLDLYLIHWPIAFKKGVSMAKSADDVISLQDMPIELTWAEMEKAKQQGLVRAIGLSNFGKKKISELMEKAEEMPSVLQVESHPYLSQKDLLDFCKENMIAFTAYSPLGSSRKSNNLMDNQVIVKIAEKVKATAAQVMLAWQINRGVVVIPKSVHNERIKENFSAQFIELDEEDMNEIDKLNEDFRFSNGKSFAFGEYTAENIFE